MSDAFERATDLMAGWRGLLDGFLLPLRERSQTRYMSMTLSETMKRCYEARELPTWGDILSAADEIDRLSRQLAEAQGQRDAARDYVLIVESERDNAEARLAEAQGVIERQRKAIKPFADLAWGFDYFSANDKLYLVAGLTVGDLRTLRDVFDEHTPAPVPDSEDER